jgi:hypothetical protein
VLARGEDHRLVLDALEPALEEPARVPLRQPPDVDAGDRDAVREPRRRAREREPDEGGEHREQRDRDEQPPRDHARGTCGGAPAAQSCRIDAHRRPVSLATSQVDIP